MAKRTEFEDKSLISHLKRALHPDIVWRLVNLKTTPDTLAAFIELVRQCDSECRQLNPNYHKKKTSSTNTSSSTTLPAPTHTTPVATNGGDAVDLNAASWNSQDVASGRRPRTIEERQARKAYCTAHSLCNWCYSPDHKPHDCPTAPWNSQEKKA